MMTKGAIRMAGLLAGVLGVVVCAAAVDKLPPVSPQAGVTYDKDIHPIFEKSCFKCHGTEKQKAKLRLDSLAAVQKGGEHGKVINVGKSADSKLVIAVARQAKNEDENMPPEGKAAPLTKEQVGLIRAWIDQGAK